MTSSKENVVQKDCCGCMPREASNMTQAGHSLILFLKINSPSQEGAIWGSKAI